MRSTIKVNTEGIKQFFEYAERSKKEIAEIEKILLKKGFQGSAKKLRSAAIAYRREFLKAIGDIEKADLSRIKKVMDAQKEYLGTQDSPEAKSDLQSVEVAGDVLDALAGDVSESTDALDQLNAALDETTEATAEAGEGFEATDEQIKNAALNIQELKERNKEIKNALESAPQKGAEGYEQLKDVIAELNAEYSDNRDTILEFNRGLRQGTQETELKQGSIFELSQSVRHLTKEYSAMSEAERESASGKELQAKIKDTREELNNLRSEIGDNRGFVGAYERALSGLGAPLQSAKAGVSGLSTAFKLLLANPVVAVISALVLGLIGLFKAFQTTKAGAEFMERASAGLAATMNVIRDVAVRIGTALYNAFNDPVGALKNLGEIVVNNILNRFKALIDIVFAAGKALKSVATLDMEQLKQSAADASVAFTQLSTGMDAQQQRAFGEAVAEVTREIREEAAAAAALTAEVQRLRDEQRGLSVDRAKMNTDLVEARDRARDANVSLSERIGLLKKVQAAESELIAKEIKNQTERIAAIKALKNQSDSDAADLDQIAQEEIKLEQLKQKSFSNSLTLRRNLLTLRREQIKLVEKERKAESEALKETEKERQRLLGVIFKSNESREKSLKAFLNKLRQIEVESIEDTTKKTLELEKDRNKKASEEREKHFGDLVDKQLRALAEINANDEISASEKKQFEDKVNADIFTLTEANNKLMLAQEDQHRKKLQQIKSDAAAAEKAAKEKEFKDEAARLEAEAAELERIENEALKKSENKTKAVKAAVIGAVGATFDIINKIQAAAAAAENKYFEDAIAARQSTIDGLEAELQNATGIHRDYLEAQIKSEREAQARLKKDAEKAAREQAEAQRIIALTQAAVNTALAVTQALGSAPPPASFILAGTAAALGAVEIATIATQKFSEGGIVEGASHENGGVPASVRNSNDVELEGGEIVINKRSAQLYKKELSEINVAGGGQKFQFGGEVAPNFEAISQTGTGDRERMLKELENLSIFVNVTDITNLQERNAKVSNQTTI